MKLAIRYIPLIVNKSNIMKFPECCPAARCSICINCKGQDKRYFICEGSPSGIMEKALVVSEKYWCRNFVVNKEKHKKLL